MTLMGRWCSKMQCFYRLNHTFNVDPDLRNLRSFFFFGMSLGKLLAASWGSWHYQKLAQFCAPALMPGKLLPARLISPSSTTSKVQHNVHVCAAVGVWFGRNYSKAGGESSRYQELYSKSVLVTWEKHLLLHHLWWCLCSYFSAVNNEGTLWVVYLEEAV